MHLIYKFTSPSGKSYIGQTNNLKRRLREHKYRTSGCTAFCNAIQKYGFDNFVVEILIDNLTHEQANELEIKYISDHDTISPNGYNLVIGGDNPLVSEETKLKHSQALKGVPKTDEHKQHLSIAAKGKPKSEHHKQTIRNIRLGKKHKPESIDKMKKPCTDKRKQMMSNIMKGKPKNIIVCPHCGKSGGEPQMKRWHFNNCKMLI